MKEEMLKQAKTLLLEDGTTFVAIAQDGSIYRSDKKGIAPMMELLAQGTNLQGGVVADKVIGRAAAMLMHQAGIIRLHARIISEHALRGLENSDIHVSFDKTVPYIINRTKTGMCPMEEAVLLIDEPEMAYEVLLEKFAKMQAGK